MTVETAASWGGESRFGFLANSGNGNELGIAERICVGYKGEFRSIGSRFPAEQSPSAIPISFCIDNCKLLINIGRRVL